MSKKRRWDGRYVPNAFSSVLPNDITLLQINPSVAVQLNQNRYDYRTLYIQCDDGYWEADRKLSDWEMDDARDQAADMVVLDASYLKGK